jgi:uncharacterized protein
MKIDIVDLINKRKTKQEVHLVFEEKPFEDDGETISFIKPIELDAEIYMTEHILTLNGTILAELSLTCSRCLTNFKHIMNIPILETFSTKPESENDEIIFIDGNEINITDIVKNNIIMSLPIKKLCKDECKGLCQYCGTNLNISTCDCGKDTIDPRLAKLKDMFSAQ